MYSLYTLPDTPFSEDGVTGHALSLLKRRRITTYNFASVPILLDIGCGYGRIAEPAVAALGIHYVGLDLRPEGLRSLAERGFESHLCDFTSEDQALARFREVLQGRCVSYITMLDALDRLPDGVGVLRAVARLAADTRSVVTLAVANVTHADVGLKLAMGSWDLTETGLLDQSRVRFFTDPILRGVTEAAGLHPVEVFDVLQLASDQHFPATHSALAPGSALHKFMRGVRSGVDDFHGVTHLVRAYLPGPALDRTVVRSEPRERTRPFLSIITRTQGLRPQSLAEVFNCLAAQTCIDFEVLVMGHKLDVNQRSMVDQLIEDTPSWLNQRIRLIPVDRGRRTYPLNVGFEAAEGRYIVILDDDDLVMGHWVETFKALEDKSPGAMLRSVAVLQKVSSVTIAGQPGVRGEGPLEKIYPSTFDFYEQLRGNQTPGLAAAFPRGVFHDLKLRFDEELTTTEDWDFMMRAASLVGVVSADEITCIYRWWSTHHSSRTEHPTSEWDQNYQRVLQKMDREMALFPTGTSAKIRELLARVDEFRAMESSLRGEMDQAQRLRQASEGERLRRIEEIQNILDSTSWQITAPLRWVGSLGGRKPLRGRDCFHCSVEQLNAMISSLRSSTSWRLTEPLRRMR